MKHIFLSPDRRAEWEMALQAGDPTALSIHEFLKQPAPTVSEKGTPDATIRAQVIESALNRACLAWIEKDTALAREAGESLKDILGEDPRSDLGKAGNALASVLAWDFLNTLMEGEQRRAFASLVEGIARSFTAVTHGNPHSVTNNWWILTHGGCLLASICVDGEEGLDGPIDLSDLAEWSLERFKAFCHQFGSAGLYHEGSGYTGYTLSMLMPALFAVERHLEPDILEQFPQFRNSLTSMLAGTAIFSHMDNGREDPAFGSSLQWNDAGRGSLPLNPFVPGMVLAHAAQRPALKTWFDRLKGVDSPQSWECPYRGLPITVAFYPFSLEAGDPQKLLPRQVLDQRQGLGIWRSEWGDGRESVFGFYTRPAHPGGHSHDDAASIRLMSQGRTWICAGGQARGKAEWQSVFTHANPEDRPAHSAFAHLTSCRMDDQGGVVGIDTRKSLGAYSERYLSWRDDLGFPFVLAVMDLLDDHVRPARDWQWNLSFPRELEARIHEDGAGFRLRDPACGAMHGRFIIDVPAELTVADMPDSTRTYSNGKKVAYPGDHYIHASFPAWKQARVLVAMVVTPVGDESEPELFLDGKAIRVAGQRWEHPFFPAILKSVDLAQSEPNRMTLPAG